MILRRALWLEHFEDGTFYDYWDSTVASGTGSHSLHEGLFVKDGVCSIRVDFTLTSGGTLDIEKTWSTPNLDLSDYDRVYFWIRASEAGYPRFRLRNNGSWGSYDFMDVSTTADTWILTYDSLSGTRNQVDGFGIQFQQAEFGTGAEVVYIDTIVVVRTDTDHYYDFGEINELRLTKGMERDARVEKTPGRDMGFVLDRGTTIRTRTLLAEWKSLADKQEFEDMMRSGDNLFFFTGLSGQHGIMVRLIGKRTDQLAGEIARHPAGLKFVETLGELL